MGQTSKADKLKAALNIAMAVAETIREMKTVPDGVLYAALMAKGIDFEGYMGIITSLKRAGLVAENGAHELRWVGPEVRS